MSMRESILSIGSRMTRRWDDIAHFDAMTYEELQQNQDQLLQKIWMLTLENDVYERYLTRYDPQIVKNITHLLESSKHARRITAVRIPKMSRMSFRESIMSLHDLGKRSITSPDSATSIFSETRFFTPSIATIRTQSEPAKLASGITTKVRLIFDLRITMAHRITMANKEVEEMRRSFENFKESARKQKAYMRSEIEELEIRTNEVQDARDDFQEEVVVKGVDPHTGKIPAEKVIRFIEEWLRTANTIIERLRLKSATMRMRIKKARQQLIYREEIGEALRAVDFEQLNIENKDCARLIEEKNRYVFDMKKIAGHYHLQLTQRKQALSDLLCALNAVKKEIALKKDQIEELEVERVNVEEDTRRMDQRLKKMLNFIDNYTAPEILDFVVLMSELEELQKTYKRLNRHRSTKRIIFQSSKKQSQVDKRPSDTRRRTRTSKKMSDTVSPASAQGEASFPAIVA